MKKLYIIVIMLALASLLGICSFSNANPMSPSNNRSYDGNDSITIIGRWRGQLVTSNGEINEGLTRLAQSLMCEFREDGTLWWWGWPDCMFVMQTTYTLEGNILTIQESRKVEYTIVTLTADTFARQEHNSVNVDEFVRLYDVPTPCTEGPEIEDTIDDEEPAPDPVYRQDTLVVNIDPQPELPRPPRTQSDNDKADEQPASTEHPNPINDNRRDSTNFRPTRRHNPTHRPSPHVNNSVLIPNGLYCYFNFDSNEIVDWQGRFTGINNGTTVSFDTPSGTGKSREFDGNSFVLAQGNIVPTNSPFSINIWFKTDTIAQVLVGSDNHGGGNRQSALYITNHSNVRYFPNSYYDNWITTGTISQCFDNQWHMMTLTYDGSMAIIYIDGTAFETKSSTRMAWGSNVNNSYIGADVTNNTNGFFKGKLDNFRSYDRVLDATEIQTLYQARQ